MMTTTSGGLRLRSHAKLQRITLAAARSIGAHCHFDPCCPDNLGGVVRAIIRDHEDTVVGSELGLNVPDGGKYSGPSLWAGISTAVRWERAPGIATDGVLPLSKARQPATTSKNQTKVRRARRLTIAITTPLTMAHIQSLNPSTQR
jgi:hypothetical protein